MTARRVEVRIAGLLCERMQHALGDLEVGDRPAETIIRTPADDEGLADVLARARDLGLHIVSVRRVPAPARPRSPGRPPSS